MPWLTQARFFCLLGSLLILTSCLGCSSGPEFGQVNGQLIVNGEPAAEVRVEFHPDAALGTKGPSSSGQTDAEGRFKLFYVLGEQTGEGAVVGQHRVVIQDQRMGKSETGRGVAIRFGPEYAAILSTPLTTTIQAGEQTLTLKVPK
ncbi:hypothetical protein NA78x_003041 [Anatilimnocola sp. NA78]|uniref:hypothetical protein n=1 Tax=Anatilimnocola sp. NA78 TaxID=3415683 RepID=UPI003CE58810